ncbi:ERIC3 protein, partial [Oenanthe oenanthe]|nr:ERIC3 protein [Oenanthe oenanthe]
YELPAVCPLALPAPPARPRRGQRLRTARRGALPDGRLQPTAAFNEQLLVRNTRGYPKSPLCSNALVTMLYLGRSKHVSLGYKDQVKVYQQYCGTENICVYKGELMEGDTFQFVSKRHLGFPFSLTLVLNGTETERLSSCCEYRHLRPGNGRGNKKRSRNSYFRVLHPVLFCRCIIAMGLDKKPSPPKRKGRSWAVGRVCPCGRAVCCELCDSSTEPISTGDSASATTPSCGTSAETVGRCLETEEESSEEE